MTFPTLRAALEAKGRGITPTDDETDKLIEEVLGVVEDMIATFDSIASSLALIANKYNEEGR